MGRNLSLLKPVIRNTYLKNKMMEKVTYLDVPEDIGLRELRSDVKNGAVHMKELDRLVEKKKEPRYIVISTDNEEQGYMAVSYLAACFARKHGEGKCDSPADCEDSSVPEYIQTDDPEDTGDEEVWMEDTYRIPVIESNALQASIGGKDPFSPFQDGNFMAGAAGQIFGSRPYWHNCRHGSVCILLKEMFSPFGMYSNSSPLIEALELFEENDKVYILSVNETFVGGTGFDAFDDDDNDGEQDDARVMVVNPLKNQVVLSFAADEAQVRLSEKDEGKRYYTNVFRSWFARKGMKAKKGFRYEPIINIILTMTDDRVCDMIEKVILYAVKDAETTMGLVLSNEDFAFADRFVRVAGKRKDREQSAKVRLEKELVGMEGVKEQIWDVVNIMKFNRIRAKMGLRGSQFHNVHMMLGAPGTAKTTAARLMGQIMVEEGLLRDNRFVCVNGAELKGMYVGHSAPKTKSLFDNNDIIVIDEAYSLVDSRGENDSFSNEAIAQLVIELENHADDRLVIFAGYGGRDVDEKDNRMKLFLDSNPGIKSRINSTFYFESYKADMMAEIFKRLAANASYQVEDGADGMLLEYFEHRRRDSNFGNGREARSLLEASVLELSKRVFEKKGAEKLTKNDVRLILAEDVRRAIAKAETAHRVQLGQERRLLGFGGR